MNRNNENLQRFNSCTTHILNVVHIAFTITIIIILQIVGEKYSECRYSVKATCSFEKFVIDGGTWICLFQIITYLILFLGIIKRKKSMFIPYFIVNFIGCMFLMAMTWKYIFNQEDLFQTDEDRHVIHLPILFFAIYITVAIVFIYEQYENLKKDELLETQNPSSNGIQIRPSNTGPSEFDRLTNFNQQSNQAQPTSFVRTENYELPSAPSGVEDSERNDSNKVKPSHHAASQNNNPKSYGWNP